MGCNERYYIRAVIFCYDVLPESTHEILPDASTLKAFYKITT